MATGTYQNNLNIYQGETFSINVNCVENDGTYPNLSGYTGFAGIKARYSSTGYLGIFDVSFLAASSGYVNLTMPATGTANLPCTIAFYQLEMSSGDSVYRYFNGKVNIFPELIN